MKSALFCATILAGVAMATGATAGAKLPLGLTMGERAQPTQSVTFDVFLPLRNRSQLDALLAAQQDQNSPQYHKWLTPSQFGAQFGPDAQTMQRAVTYLRKQGFSVTTQTRSLHVTGNASQVTSSFGIALNVARTHDGHSILVQSAVPVMPNELASLGAHIVGFTPHVKHVFAVKPTLPLALPDNRYSADGPYWYDDLKQAYQYPANDAVSSGKKKIQLNGTGATIGVLISSDVLDADINAVFNHEHWTATTGLPNPQLFARRYIDGAVPGGFSPFSNDSFEASLDVQQELGGAPGAHVILNDIPDLSDAHVIDGYIDIVEANDIDVVSSSFGLCELFYTADYNLGTDFTYILGIYDEIFAQGNSQGISFLASSGDNAGKECLSLDFTQFIAGVSTPAADPNVTAVGGTNLVTTFTPPVLSKLNSAYVGENAWADPLIPYDPFGIGINATGGFWGAGGGYSTLFAKPPYQFVVATGSDTQRSVPDIGMQVGGCPLGIAALDNGICDGGPSAINGNGNTDRSAAIVGFDVAFYHGFFGVIGTSVSSPELAGAVANLIATQGRQGNLNYYIYGLAGVQSHGGQKFYHTNIPGYNGVQNTLLNGAYSLSTGAGTPIVTQFILQPSGAQAGVPRTPSNP
jgi:subtilase family serine protease